MPTRLHQMVVGTLAELRELGLTLDPVNDWDHVMQLHRLACACAGVDDPWEPHVPDPVLTIKGLTLRKPTFGAALWLEDHADRWWGESEPKMALALIYAMIYGRREFAMRLMHFRPHAERELGKLAKRIAGPFPEVAEAVRYFVNSGPSSSLTKSATPGDGVIDPDPPPTVAFIVSCVQEVYGGTLKAYLWGQSKEWTQAQLTQYILRHRGERNEPGKPDPNDPHLLAFTEYNKARDALVELKRKERDELAAEKAKEQEAPHG